MRFRTWGRINDQDLATRIVSTQTSQVPAGQEEVWKNIILL